jgi:hypothetical protein
MTDPMLPPPQRSVFLDDGREFADFSGSDYGEQPEWEKEEILGQGIIIRGLSDATFEPEGSNMGPARSVLYNLITDDPDAEPWGMFFTDWGVTASGKEDQRNSTVIKQVRAAMARNGGRAFLAQMEKETSETHKGQTYYKLVKYVRNVTPEDAFPKDAAPSTTKTK